MKYFQANTFQKGYILTTKTSGSQNIFLISKGKILTFVSNKYNEEYPYKFILFSMLDKTNSFNENNTLLDKDNAYGTMIIEDNTEILEIEKKDLVMVSDEDSINLF